MKIKVREARRTPKVSLDDVKAELHKMVTADFEEYFEDAIDGATFEDGGKTVAVYVGMCAKWSKDPDKLAQEQLKKLDTDKLSYVGARPEDGSDGYMDFVMLFKVLPAGFAKQRSEDRRGPDRYGHRPRRFTARDVANLPGEGEGEPFGYVTVGSASMSAYSNNYKNSNELALELKDKPVSQKSIEDALKKVQLSRFRDPIFVHSYYPERGLCFVGPMYQGQPCKSIRIAWGPAI